MKQPTLSIIIPHYKETIEFMLPLLTGLDNQRLIDYGTVELIIVNDCGEPFHVEQFERFEHIRPHLISNATNSGCGVARQTGLDYCHGKFAMFIDADDCLYSPLSLFMILAEIRKRPDTELFHGQFIEEQIVDEQYGLYLHEKDITFCHGKVYNVAFLREKNLRCHPALRYNEDSYFNALIYSECTRIEYNETPLTIWCCNANSTVRNGGLYLFEKLPDYITAMSDLVAELLARKKPQTRTQFLQALNQIYFYMQDEAWELKRIAPLRVKAIQSAAEYFKRHEKLYDCGMTERLNFFSDCRKQFGGAIMEKQTFNQFMEEICK